MGQTVKGKINVIPFILFILFCVGGIKGCSMMNNHESTKYKTVTATVVDKYSYIGKSGSFSSKRYFVALVRPDVKNPRLVDDNIDESLYNRIDKGDKITITYRNYLLTTDQNDGLSTLGALLGALSWILAICSFTNSVTNE